MTTSFDPTLAMASSGELPPNRKAAAAPSCGDPGLAAQAQTALASVGRRVTDAFEKRPFAFLAAAAGAGALVGWLVRR